MTNKSKKTEETIPEPRTGESLPKEKTLSDLVSGDTFILGKEKYRLMQVFADRYQVVKLKTVKNQVAPKKYVDAEVGVEIHDMLGDTVIE